MAKTIVLFDGVCNLCNNAVQFIIKRDPKGLFAFASLQSNVSSDLLIRYGLAQSDLKSIVVLVPGAEPMTKSDGILEISRNLSGFWSLLYLFRFIPKQVRDWVYDRVAANRYSWFGKKGECMVPSEALKIRFLDA